MLSPSQQISTCLNCGGGLEETPGGGLGCMSCLFRAGIGSEEEVAQDSNPKALENGARFGVYEIDCHADGSLCELGRGAMGVTYRATDTSLQRKVALKIIKIDIAARSADARERFMREARAAASLRHENIATIHQFGMRLETGQYFYAMELIEGENLEERVRRAGPLDARTTIGIAEQVTSALAVAEKHGLVHRDLKPANLMLVSSDGETAVADRVASGTATQRRDYNVAHAPVAASLRRGAHQKHEKLLVKIIDFGLAKAFHSATDPKSLTHDRFVGTPAFASPEQFEHAAVDVRSDIYSLGETMWFALTGKTPFAGRSVDEIHRAQQSNALPLEQLKAAHVPHRLKSLLEPMLAFEPSSRPGTRELAARLRRCSPEARSVRRTRFALAAASLVVLGMSALFVFQPSRIQNAPLNPAPEKSIAVLPLLNSTGDPANEYFSDGMSEEFISTLSRLRDLKVIGRTSSFQFKGKTDDSKTIGEKLGVYYLLEGSVRKSADRMRIAVAMIKSGDGANVWSETYDRELKDIFAVQSEIAAAVAKELKVALLGHNGQTAQLATAATPSNQNVEAYNALLQGNFYANRYTAEDYRKAIGYYEEAIRLDPRYALAYAELSNAAVSLAVNYAALPTKEREEAIAKARASAKRALELDPHLADAHSVQGTILMLIDFNFGTAEAEYRRALELAPQYAAATAQLATLLSTLGRLDEAVALGQRAIALEPLRAALHCKLAHSLIPLGRYDEAEAALRKAIELQPQSATNYASLAIVQILRGNPGAAVELAKQETDPFWRTYGLALAHFAHGDRADADAGLKKLIDENADDAGSQIAEVYALRKDPEKMFEWLEHAWTTHDSGVTDLLANPFLRAYKDDPRFIAFAKKIGVMPKAATHP